MSAADWVLGPLRLSAEMRAPFSKLIVPACTRTSPPRPGVIGTIDAGRRLTSMADKLFGEPRGPGSPTGTLDELNVIEPMRSDQLFSVTVSLKSKSNSPRATCH